MHSDRSAAWNVITGPPALVNTLWTGGTAFLEVYGRLSGLMTRVRILTASILH